METPTQRRTSAAAAGVNKPAGAMSSAFDVPKQPAPPKATRKTYAPLNPDSVPILWHEPIPNAAPKRAEVYTALLARITAEPGTHAVQLPDNHARNLMRAAKAAGLQLARRRISNDITAVWITSPATAAKA